MLTNSLTDLKGIIIGYTDATIDWKRIFAKVNIMLSIFYLVLGFY